jgi:hypothetical protein
MHRNDTLVANHGFLRRNRHEPIIGSDEGRAGERCPTQPPRSADARAAWRLKVVHFRLSATLRLEKQNFAE